MVNLDHKAGFYIPPKQHRIGQDFILNSTENRRAAFYMPPKSNRVHLTIIQEESNEKIANSWNRMSQMPKTR